MAQQDMLINYAPGEECRIAITEGGKLEELYTERAADDLHVGNIYRGKVTNVESSIQAAFIDFGLERNGFLHISDLHPRYFPGEDEDTMEKVGKKTPRKHRPPIQAALKRGQEILVQVLKEGIGTKGPTLTTYLSIPGRFLVMMPNMERHGVSRKVEDEDQRREMRKILDELDPPDSFGFIVRTAGIGRTKTELKRDLAYLQRLWRTINRRMKQGKGPTELYVESDLIIRTLRDVMTSDVKRVIMDDEGAARRAKDFLRIVMPRSSTKVIHYHDTVPLFDAFGIEQQIDHIHSREVPLPSGGSLVIDQTEAMVAIDVNSGKYRAKNDAEETAFRTNIEAVDEIARQLRLRDLGGLLVLDLIDMYMAKHRRSIEQRFRENLKKDRARSRALRINELGLVSLTRQRMRPSLKTSRFHPCPRCAGTGSIATPETVVLDIMRRLAVVSSNDKVRRIEMTVAADVASVLFNRKREALIKLEQEAGKPIKVIVDPNVSSGSTHLVVYDQREGEIDLSKLSQPSTPKFTEADEVSDAGRPIKDEEEEPIVEAEDEGDSASDEQREQEQSDDPSGKKKGRSRRRRRRKSRDEASGDGQEVKDEQPDEKKQEAQGKGDDGSDKDGDSGDQGGKSRRRRRRRRKPKKSDQDGGDGGDRGESQGKDASGGPSDSGEDGRSEKSDHKDDSSEGKRGSRGRGRSRSRRKSGGDSGDKQQDRQDDKQPQTTVVGSGYRNPLREQSGEGGDHS